MKKSRDEHSGIKSRNELDVVRSIPSSQHTSGKQSQQTGSNVPQQSAGDTPGTKIATTNIGPILFNCTDLSQFIASIKQSLPFRGYSMSRFYLCEHNGLQFLTKMAFYNKTAPELYLKSNPELLSHIDAEISILRVFNEKFTEGGITPCVIELIYSQICEGLSALTPAEDICSHLLPNYDTITPSDNVEQSLCNQKNLVDEGLAYDKIAFLVLDKCDQSLSQWLRGYSGSPVSFALLKSILFMILHAFVMFRRAYPGFIHYDLHDDNILLKIDNDYVFDPHNPRFLLFPVDGATYAVPYFGIIPKIIDFGFSSLPEKNLVSNVVADKIQMYFRADHDIILLLYWIRKQLITANVQNAAAVFSLLAELDPTGVHKHYNTKTIRKMHDKILSYEDMLKLPVWDIYRKHVPSKYVWREYNSI